MQITLNGQSHTLTQPLSLAMLIEQCGCQNKRIAVEHNLNIVPSSAYTTTRVNEGDRVEIIHAIGGG